MRHAFMSLFLPLLLGTAGAEPVRQETTTTATPYEDNDAYQVYSAALSNWTVSGKAMFIQKRMVTGDRCIAPAGPFAEQVREADSDRRRLAQESLSLVNHFDIPVQLLNATDAREVSRKIAQQEDPDTMGGLVSLSAVGFNKDRSVAVLYIGRYCGLSCGTWTSAAYVKTAGKWKPLEGQVVCQANS